MFLETHIWFSEQNNGENNGFKTIDIVIPLQKGEFLKGGTCSKTSCGGKYLNGVHRHPSQLSVPEVPLRYLLNCDLIGGKYKQYLSQ